MGNIPVLKALIGMSADTSANWANVSNILPPGLLLYETDTGNMKVSDGTKPYTQLPYKVEESLSTPHKELLVKAGQPGGVVVLNASGKLDSLHIETSEPQLPMSVVSCRMLPRKAPPWHDLQLPEFLSLGRFEPSSFYDTTGTYAVLASSSFLWSAIKFPTLPGAPVKSLTLDVRTHGTTKVRIQVFQDHDNSTYNSGSIANPVGGSLDYTFTSNGVKTIDLSSLGLVGDGSYFWVQFTYLSGSGVSVNTMVTSSNVYGMETKRSDGTNINNFKSSLLMQYGTLTEADVVLAASADIPFEAAFPGNGKVICGKVTAPISMVPESQDGSHWVYVERDPVTGQISLGSRFAPLSCGAKRKAIEGNCFSVSSDRTLDVGSLAYLTAAGYGGGLPFVTGQYAQWNAASADPNVYFSGSSLTYIRSLRISSPRTRTTLVKNWDVYGSNDGSTWILIATLPAMANADWIGDQMYVDTPLPSDVPAYRDYRVHLHGFTTGAVVISEIELLTELAGDLYVPSAIKLYDHTGAIKQRVYIGKLVRSGGEITELISFHPGKTTYVPVNRGNNFVANMYYTEHNPFGLDAEMTVQTFAKPAALSYHDWLDEAENVGGGAGVKEYYVTPEILRFNLGSKGSSYSTNGKKMRIRVHRLV